MRITNAAEYGVPVELIGGDAAPGAFRGDAQTGRDGRFDKFVCSAYKRSGGSECFVSRVSKIMYS